MTYDELKFDFSYDEPHSKATPEQRQRYKEITQLMEDIAAPFIQQAVAKHGYRLAGARAVGAAMKAHPEIERLSQELNSLEYLGSPSQSPKPAPRKGRRRGKP